MNDRVKQLYETAIIATGKENRFTTTNIDVAERFAVLIVEECMQINKEELSFAAFERLINRYQKHFGVKE
jgi:hypothetical protein